MLLHKTVHGLAVGKGKEIPWKPPPKRKLGGKAAKLTSPPESHNEGVMGDGSSFPCSKGFKRETTYLPMFHFRRVRVGEGGKEGGLSQKNTIFSIAQLCPRILSFARSMLCQKIKTHAVCLLVHENTRFTPSSRTIFERFFAIASHIQALLIRVPEKKIPFFGSQQKRFLLMFSFLVISYTVHCLSFPLLTWVIYGVQSSRESSRADFLIVIRHAVNGFDIIQLKNKKRILSSSSHQVFFWRGPNVAIVALNLLSLLFLHCRFRLLGPIQKWVKGKRNRYLLHRMTEL